MSGESRDFDNKNTPLKGVTGVILAGGKSSRYGKNKALEEVEGSSLCEECRTEGEA